MIRLSILVGFFSLSQLLFADILENKNADLEATSAVKSMNQVHVSKLNGFKGEEVDSVKLIQFLAHEISRITGKQLVVRWELSGEWKPAKAIWKVGEHSEKTLRELLNKIVEKEERKFRIYNGVLVIKQFT